MAWGSIDPRSHAESGNKRNEIANAEQRKKSCPKIPRLSDLIVAAVEQPLLVIAGPCVLEDAFAAISIAQRLKEIAGGTFAANRLQGILR